ncbi:TRAP transporter small permease [Oceanispirochaeta sp.]|jgi:TRAP-type C4-dicarboxylate transport system permease small subunit|uniref:TRAP transporter small permease n=1 Tax=Oceanispirochaeta sp. TaxID=2035350 RepID=UPI00260F0627|nr:TRAP transporter small permease [Oceanispirochaeta sp.]MDA3955625.1 TRAP transporter small permease [Oceanispirochaeta sp.]
MNKFIKTLDRILSVFCFSMMGIMTVGIIMSVFLRYVFNITFVKAEEAITMVFVATTFFGAALGIREYDHINIAYFRDKGGPRVRRYIDVFVNVIIIFVMIFLFKNSLIWIDKVGDVRSPGMQVPTKYLYVMVPISSVLSIFYALVNILKDFMHIDKPEYGYERVAFGDDGIFVEDNEIKDQGVLS